MVEAEPRAFYAPNSSYAGTTHSGFFGNNSECESESSVIVTFKPAFLNTIVCVCLIHIGQEQARIHLYHEDGNEYAEQSEP